MADQSIWGSTGVTPVGTYRAPVDTGAAGSPSHVVLADLVTFTQLEGYGLDNQGSVTGAVNFDFSIGRYSMATFIGNTTVSFSSPPSGAFVQILRLTNAGAFVITWPASVSWTSGTTPSFRSSGVDIVRLYSVNGGTSYLAELAYDEQNFNTSIQWQEEGSNLGASGTVTTVNFVGSGVTASRSTDTITVTISTPAHASTHQAGGTDPIKLDDLATPDDNTDLDATTTRHGLLPKLGGGTTNFLRADGTWAAPSGGGGSPGGSGTQWQYRDGTAFGGIPGTAVDTSGRTVTSDNHLFLADGRTICLRGNPGTLGDYGLFYDGTSDSSALFGYATRNVTIGFRAYNFGTYTPVVTFSDSTDTITLADGWNFAFNTSTGTKIGTGATQKIGFWNATPAAQPAAIADTSGAVLLALEAEVNKIKQALRSIGLIAT